MTKPYLLFATPRSGSTPVYFLFLEYFKKSQGVCGLGELFNLSIQSVWKENDEVIARFFSKHLTLSDLARTSNSLGYHSIAAKILSMRCEFLFSKPDKYFFKIFSHQIPPSHADWMIQSYEWIFLERKNVFQQCLSYLLSLNSGIWYAKDGISVPKGSVRAYRAQLRRFEDQIWGYHYMKRRLKPRTVLYYEDFTKMPPDQFLTSAGLIEKIDITGALNPGVQNVGKKEMAFENLDEICTWYQNSTLNNLFSISNQLGGDNFRAELGR